MTVNPDTDLVVGAAIATPITSTGVIDHAALVAHGHDLLSRGVNSLALFGTTGEGSGFDHPTRMRAVRACIDGGIDPESLGLGMFEISAAAATRHCIEAFDAGCQYALLCPPLYFKDLSDEGLFAWFSDVFFGVGEKGRYVLYHIPQVTHVPLSIELIQRLAAAYPDQIVGVKDSAGDWSATQALIKACPDLSILVGHEGQIADAIKLGARGSICALANVVPEAMANIITSGEQDERVVALIEAAAAGFLIGAVKAMIAHDRHEAIWHAVAPPLMALPDAERGAILATYQKLFG